MFFTRCAVEPARLSWGYFLGQTTVTAGKKADFVVLDTWRLTVPFIRIKDTMVERA